MQLLVHRFHNGAYDRGKDRAAASAAKGIAEKAAQRPARGRIGTSSPAEKGTKECASSDTADCTTNDFGQLAHRHLLQDRTDSLTAEDASNNLNNDRKNCFHVEIPRKEPEQNRPGSHDCGPSNAFSQAERYKVRDRRRAICLPPSAVVQTPFMADFPD